MKTKQIKYRQWTGTEWRYWGFIDGIFVAPIQGIEDSYQLLPFTDKDGDEIWEGDFVKQYNEIELVSWKIVGWDPFAFNYSCSCCAPEDYIDWDEEECEVIGNIKENPELLEELNKI